MILEIRNSCLNLHTIKFEFSCKSPDLFQACSYVEIEINNKNTIYPSPSLELGSQPSLGQGNEPDKLSFISVIIIDLLALWEIACDSENM